MKVKGKTSHNYSSGENGGWYWVQCPKSFENMTLTYILTLCPRLLPAERERGWKHVLGQNFKNAHDGYFNTKCANTVTQTDYVKKRYELRVELQQRHYVSYSVAFSACVSQQF